MVGRITQWTRSLGPGIALAGALLAAGSPAQCAGARAFPSTADRTLVFADMLPTQMSDAQWRFAATHYAGTQKQTVSWIRRMRALNPGFLMLHYQLAVGTGPALFVEGDKWVNDFPAVSRQEAWFLRSPDGGRILQTAWNWYVMDIRFKDGKPLTGYPAYWANAAIRRMRLNEADGCFADSYTQDILMNQTRPCAPIFSDVALCKNEWLPNLNLYGAYCTDRLHDAPERFYFLPNLGGQVTTWDTMTKLGVGDGGMIEGFASGRPGDYYSEADWALQMTRVLGLAREGKIVIGQTSTDAANADHRWFIIGSYLLTRGPKSYLNMFQTNSLEWYPEYTVELGEYKQPPAKSVDAYWYPAWRVYRRDYAKGTVLVNPSGQAVSIADLGRAYRLVSAEGGGAVPEDGSMPGRLTTVEARSLNVPAHSARALMLP